MFFMPPYHRLPYLRLRNVKMGHPTTYVTKASYFVWFILLITVAAGAIIGGLIPGMIAEEGASENDVAAQTVMYVGIGALAGLVLGAIISLIGAFSCKAADKAAEVQFEEVRKKLSSVRRIVCESRAVTDDFYAFAFIGDYSYKRGRLYLTYDAVEFYDDQFNVDYKNFLINIHDICFVKPRCMFRHKLCLYTRSGKYVIRVPFGTASFWCRQIRHVMQRGSRSVRPTTFVSYY